MSKKEKEIMAAMAGNDYNATTNATAGTYLLDCRDTASAGFALPDRCKRWEWEWGGWYYDGKRYETKKKMLVAKNKDLSIKQVLVMRDLVCSGPIYKNVKTYCYRLLKRRNALSRRQIAVQKRKARLHSTYRNKK